MDKKYIEMVLNDKKSMNVSIMSMMLLRCITVILYDIWKRNYDTKPKGKKQ